MSEGDMPPGLQPDFSGLDIGRVSALLSSRRTGMSLHRTRMSADRTLMSVVRTSLALIGFGFTIFQFFRYLRQSVGEQAGLSPGAPRTFAMTLVLLGIVMLTLGILNHVRFMVHLRFVRRELADAKLIQAQDTFPLSTTLVVAAALWVAGLVAFLYMAGRAAGH